jgi:alpha-beta hydrolase superfamily lysophospholipase
VLLAPRRQAESMTRDTFLLDTADGYPVVVHHWEPRAEPRGVVNLVHGMAEHASRYAYLADALIDAGYAVYAEDHRGHGDTAAADDEVGFFTEERGWATVLDDLHRVTLRARADHPDVPTFLMGHSMGSFLAQQYLFTFPTEIDGLVLSGSNGPNGAVAGAGAVVARAERRRIGPRGRSKLLDTLSFGAYNKPFEPARTDFDWLSRDPDQVDAYIADPRCGFLCTPQFWLDLFAGIGVIGKLDRVREGARSELPVYIFAGSEDPVGGTKGTNRLVEHYAAAGLTNVQHRLYEGGRHEMLNEINRDEVIGELLGWLGAQLRDREQR